MKELEKILEEIDAEFERRIGTQLKIMAGLGDDVYRYGYGKSLEAYQQGKLLTEKIIRKYMNDGWIPVKERLPVVQEDFLDDDDCLEFNVTIEGAKKATTLNYSPADGTWFDDLGDVYSVIAWQPLPELYREGEQEHECDR